MKNVLDHGYVKLVESFGSDERIIEAARMSTQKGFEGWGPKCKVCGSSKRMMDGPPPIDPDGRKPEEICANCWDCALEANTETVPGDEKLLRYLYTHKHMTPFEMAGAVFEVQAPIFVIREWHRHRTQSYNEMSSRYAPLPDVNYIPSIERLLANRDESNKQAGTIAGAGQLDAESAREYQRTLGHQYMQAQQLYELALQIGVPKELARVHLPVGRYSRMRASANLRNWLAFLALRQAPDAQWEIRQYADAICTELTRLFPRTLSIYLDG